MLINKFFNKFLKKNNILTLFLIDILYMKDLNAIYSFKNGDYILKQLKQILSKKIRELIKKELNKNIFIEVNNTHSDIFELSIYENLSIEEILSIKDIIYDSIVSHNFNLLNSKSTINIDITIGCTKGADEDIKIHAEKALFSAKSNYLHYMYLDSYLSKNEFVIPFYSIL